MPQGALSLQLPKYDSNMNDFYIALGANLLSSTASPTASIRAAVSRLDQPDIRVESVSALYQTPCFPAGAGPDYVNAAVHLTSVLDPDALLARLHEIEAEFGRERKERWASRTLDLDLIACGNRVLPDRDTYEHWRCMPLSDQKTKSPPQLILPHPRVQDRAFVLVPLRDIAADWVHPVLNRSVLDMCNALSAGKLEEIVRIEH